MTTFTPQELESILKAHKDWLDEKKEGSRANLSRADLTRANLTRANLSRANLTRAYLSRAYLSRANLTGADLSCADLSGANLTGADLYGADLSRADLSRADLSGADLSRADLSRADLTGADLTGANLYGADKILSYLTEIIRTDGYKFFAFVIQGKGLMVKAGCRYMSVPDYHNHIAREYPNTDKARETLSILTHFELLFHLKGGNTP